MAHRRKPHVDMTRLELIEEASDHFSMQWARERIREEGGQPAKSVRDIALEQVIAEVLTKEELELVHNIARGDVEAPYPPRLYPDQCPTTLRDMAYVPAGSLEVASLEERRRKRDVG